MARSPLPDIQAPAVGRSRIVPAMAYEFLMAVSMTAGRGRASRAVVEAARLDPADTVVDVGCGPGTAVRQASRSARAVVGVDPSPLALALARWIAAVRPSPGITWALGPAEHLPVPDELATVVWALASLHHWSDKRTGLTETHRILRPGGRLIIAERLTRAGAKGHAAHGLSGAEIDEVIQELRTAGFDRIDHEMTSAGRRRLVLISAHKPPRPG